MLNIIYEDKNLIAVHKPAGLATQTAKISEKDLVSEVSGYIAGKKGNAKSDPFIGLINRLDQPVEGIVLIGLDKKTTADLSEQLRAGNIEKHYYAAFAGKAPLEEALVADYMIKDAKTNTSRIVDKGTEGAQNALLEFKVISTTEEASLADIHLITGRHHQIRLQMSNADMSLLGDRKYASDEAWELSERLGITKIALCAYSLSFTHPASGKKLNLEVKPEGKWFELFKI